MDVIWSMTAVTATVFAAPAAQAQMRTFDLAEQPAVTGVPAFARQSGMQIVAATEALEGVTTRAVRGRYEPRTALAVLLAGTSLEPVRRSENKVALRRIQPGSRPVAASEDVIVVTAQKRSDGLSRVPLAVSVVSGDEIAARRVTDFTGLVDEVPGLSINYAFGGATYGLLSIRGVGGADDYKPNGSPSVALHVDGIYQTSNAYLGMPLFDLDRIEILKGPQGTLYGRNTTAGVINAITRGPGTTTDGFVDVKAGSYGLFAAEGAVGGPLSETIGLRLALTTEQGGGYMQGRGAGLLSGFRLSVGNVVQNQVPAIVDPGPRDGFGDKRLFAGRATLAVDLTPLTRLTVKGFGSRDRGDTLQYDRINRARDATIFNAGEDDDPFVFFSRRYYRHKIDIAGGSAALSHDFGTVRLDVLGGYQASQRRVGGNGDGTPYPQFEFTFDERLRQTSIEARLSNVSQGTFNWIVGAFYIDDVTDFLSIWDSFSVRSIYESAHRQDRNSAAVFAQGDVEVLPRLRINAGGRYTRDRAHYVGRNIDINPYGISTFNTTFGTTSPFSWDKRFADSNVSGRIGVQYFATENFNVFASAATGYRAGGFDGTSIFTLEETEPFRSETVVSYEAGARLLTGPLRLSLDIFSNQFRDLQATTRLANDTNGRTNVGRAKTRGIEASATLKLIDRPEHSLTLDAAAAYLYTRITEFSSRRIADVQATVGDPLPGAPDITARLSLTHDIALGGPFGLTTRVSVSHHGRESNRLNALPNNTSAAYTLVNARVDLRIARGVSVYVYGRNITDEVYFPELNGASRLVGAPATFGGGARFVF